MSTAQDPNAWMAEEIFKSLSGLGHKVYMYDEKGSRVYDPNKADRLFSDSAKMMITMGWTKGKPAKPRVTFHVSDVTDSQVLTELKNTLKQHNLYDHSFDTMPYGKTLEPKHFAHMNKKAEVTESAWTGSTRTSRWKTGLTEVVIRHNQVLADPESSRRWCRIKDIFIHGPDGSRYKFDQRHILGAKALAQHMDRQGQPWDDNGKIIQDLIQCLMELRHLKRWCQKEMPHMYDVVCDAQKHIKTLIHQMSQPDSYDSAMQTAQHMHSGWHTAQVPPTWSVEKADLAQRALAYLAPHMFEPVMPTEPEPATDSFPELQAVFEWLGHDPKKDIQTAQEETGSQDARRILNHLSDQIPGWESKFEQDPKQVLDQIMAELKKLQNI